MRPFKWRKNFGAQSSGKTKNIDQKLSFWVIFSRRLTTGFVFDVLLINFFKIVRVLNVYVLFRMELKILSLNHGKVVKYRFEIVRFGHFDHN